MATQLSGNSSFSFLHFNPFSMTFDGHSITLNTKASDAKVTLPDRAEDIKRNNGNDTSSTTKLEQRPNTAQRSRRSDSRQQKAGYNISAPNENVYSLNGLKLRPNVSTEKRRKTIRLDDNSSSGRKEISNQKLNSWLDTLHSNMDTSANHSANIAQELRKRSESNLLSKATETRSTAIEPSKTASSCTDMLATPSSDVNRTSQPLFSSAVELLCAN